MVSFLPEAATKPHDTLSVDGQGIVLLGAATDVELGAREGNCLANLSSDILSSSLDTSLASLGARNCLADFLVILDDPIFWWTPGQRLVLIGVMYSLSVLVWQGVTTSLPVRPHPLSSLMSAFPVEPCPSAHSTGTLASWGTVSLWDKLWPVVADVRWLANSSSIKSELLWNWLLVVCGSSGSAIRILEISSPVLAWSSRFWTLFTVFALCTGLGLQFEELEIWSAELEWLWQGASLTIVLFTELGLQFENTDTCSWALEWQPFSATSFSRHEMLPSFIISSASCSLSHLRSTLITWVEFIGVLEHTLLDWSGSISPNKSWLHVVLISWGVSVISWGAVMIPWGVVTISWGDPCADIMRSGDVGGEQLASTGVIDFSLLNNCLATD